MAVIVRVTNINEIGEKETTIQYRTMRPPTHKEIKKAKEVDAFLHKKMLEIRDNLHRNGLLKERLGNLARWHALGGFLAEIVDDPLIISPEDRAQDRYIWEAIGQHSPAELHPGKKKSVSKNIGTHRDHFRLCYLVATFQKDYARAERQGTWRDWVELLESKSLLRDERILAWTQKKLDLHPEIKLRPMARMLRNLLKEMYTKVLNDNELDEFLNNGWNEMLRVQQEKQ